MAAASAAGCCVSKHCTKWVDSKATMRRHSAICGATCQLSRQDGEHGNRMYTCFGTWADAVASGAFEETCRPSAHIREVIIHGQPCKPYLIVRAARLLAGCSLELVAEQIQAAVVQVFKEDFKVRLPPSACVWTCDRQRPTEVSLQLVVSMRHPQLVYRSNHQEDEQGAIHLALRVCSRLPPELAAMIDLSAYTKDKEIDLPSHSSNGRVARALFHSSGGSSGSSGSGSNRDMDLLRNAAITWLDDAPHELHVPTCLPRNIYKNDSWVKTYRNVGQAHGHALHTHDRSNPFHRDAFVRGRMLDLLQAGPHPSARIQQMQHEHERGQEDPYEPAAGLTFSYAHPAEVCCNGQLHQGGGGVRCWVEDERVHAQCLQCSSTTQHSKLIGLLHANPDAWAEHAVRLSMQYLQPENPILGQVLKQWLDSVFKVLSLRSPMGTGKTTLLQHLLRHSFPNGRVLIITHRQSLAHEFARKLKEFNFTLYMNVTDRTTEHPLADRSTHPRVICSLESLHRLGYPLIPQFDLVVLDEVSSLLVHFTSSTMQGKAISCLHFLCNMLRNAGKVLSMDAYWDAAAHAFFSKCKLSQRLVINEHRPQQRHYICSEDKDAWMACITNDLQQGKNVVVASMSSTVISELKKAVLKAGIVAAHKVLCHTSRTGDEVKQLLRDVDALWCKYCLVMYSPTIEAGVDFSTSHFHAMYMYACHGSTTPHGAVQMSGRVRKLQQLEVHICFQKGMLAQTHRPSTVQEGRMYVRYMHNFTKALSSTSAAVVLEAEEGRQLSLSLPDDDVVFELAAHNEAAAANSQLCFFQEFKRLLNEGGHEVRHGLQPDAAPRTPKRPRPATAPSTPSRSVRRKVAVASTPRTPRRTPAEEQEAEEGEHKDPSRLTPDQHDLLQAQDMRTWQQWVAVRNAVSSNTASEQVKLEYRRHCIKAFFAVDSLDAAFLRDHGGEAGRKQLTLLMQMVYPELYRGPELDPTHGEPLVVKAQLVKEVLAALGFAHVFDLQHSFKEDMPTVYETRLLNTRMFQDYQHNIRLFSSKAKESPDFKTQPLANQKIAKALKVVLGAIGLKLASGRPQDTFGVRNNQGMRDMTS